MAVLHLVRETTAPPSAVWSVVTDFAAYGRWMPMTRMRTDDGRPRVGWGFVGVSGLGPLGFADSMLVTLWDPPVDGTSGQFRIVKTGRLLGGWADIRIVPHQDGSLLEWREDVVVRPLPFKRVFAPLLDRASAWLYGRAIDGMLTAAVTLGHQGRR